MGKGRKRKKSENKKEGNFSIEKGDLPTEIERERYGQEKRK